MATKFVRENIYPEIINFTLTAKPTKQVEYETYLSKINYPRSQNAVSRYLKELGIKKNEQTGIYEVPPEDLSIQILEVIKEDITRNNSELIISQDIDLLCCTFYGESTSRYRFNDLIRQAFSQYIITTIITDNSVILITNSKDSSAYISEKLVSLMNL